MNIEQNKELQQYNSFKTKAVAKLFANPKTVDDITRLIKTFPEEKKLVLGAGCNLLFTENFNGLVIKPDMQNIQLITNENDYVEIEADAAVDWDTFVENTLSHGYSGLENLSFIPGSVGASPIQNIGAYGVEVKETITGVKAIDINSGEKREFTNRECRFAYRDSLFKHHRNYIITSVIFRLNKTFSYSERYIELSRELRKNSSPTLSQVREAIFNIRKRKLPDIMEVPNAGSFFKNPILTPDQKKELQRKIPDIPFWAAGEDRFKTSAAFLIEKAGYKGKRSGMVGIFKHHSLIIVNWGTDDGKEIVKFADMIVSEVERQFGIKLEPEVWIY